MLRMILKSELESQYLYASFLLLLFLQRWWAWGSDNVCNFMKDCWASCEMLMRQHLFWYPLIAVWMSTSTRATTLGECWPAAEQGTQSTTAGDVTPTGRATVNPWPTARSGSARTPSEDAMAKSTWSPTTATTLSPTPSTALFAGASFRPSLCGSSSHATWWSRSRRSSSWTASKPWTAGVLTCISQVAHAWRCSTSLMSLCTDSISTTANPPEIQW